MRDDERAQVRRLTDGGEPPAAGAAESAPARIWRQLELPPAAGAPPGFAARVAARAAAERRAAFELPLSPRWARAAAALAVAAGVVVGASLGLLTAVDEEAAAALAWSEASLAEELVAGLDAGLSSLAAPAAADEVTP